MENQEILNKTKDALSPFETENLIKFVRELSFSYLISHPWLLLILLIILFYAIIKRSKFVLLFLFTFISLSVLIKYTLPASGELNLSSLLPFVGGGLAIGGVLIYFIFIQSE